MTGPDQPVPPWATKPTQDDWEAEIERLRALVKVLMAGLPPMRCDNCGKTMAEHGSLANCWAEWLDGRESPEGRAGQEDAALRRGGGDRPAPPGYGAPTGVWMSYHYDWSGFAVFDTEVAALRDAVSNHRTVGFAFFGQDYGSARYPETPDGCDITPPETASDVHQYDGQVSGNLRGEGGTDA